MTPEQQSELDELHRLANSLLERIGMLRAGLQDGDPYMPTPVEWAEYPWAEWVATDDDGEMWLYTDRPHGLPPSVMWHCGGCGNLIALKQITPPADFTTTLRKRPEGI